MTRSLDRLTRIGFTLTDETTNDWTQDLKQMMLKTNDLTQQQMEPLRDGMQMRWALWLPRYLPARTSEAPLMCWGAESGECLLTSLGWGRRKAWKGDGQRAGEETAEQRGKSGDPTGSAMSASSMLLSKDAWGGSQRPEDDPREDPEDQHHDTRRAVEGIPPLPGKLNQASLEKRKTLELTGKIQCEPGASYSARKSETAHKNKNM